MASHAFSSKTCDNTAIIDNIQFFIIFNPMAQNHKEILEYRIELRVVVKSEGGKPSGLDCYLNYFFLKTHVLIHQQRNLTQREHRASATTKKSAALSSKTFSYHSLFLLSITMLTNVKIRLASTIIM
jgi:hypothetical protein